MIHVELTVISDPATVERLALQNLAKQRKPVSVQQLSNGLMGNPEGLISRSILGQVLADLAQRGEITEIKQGKTARYQINR